MVRKDIGVPADFEQITNVMKPSIRPRDAPRCGSFKTLGFPAVGFTTMFSLGLELFFANTS